MRNKHPGVCYRCGEIVPAGEGHFERLSRERREALGLRRGVGRWLVQHADCAIKHRRTDNVAPSMMEAAE